MHKPHTAWLDTGKLVQPNEWASARAILKGESVFEQIMEIESFDGVRKIVLNSAAPVRDADGRLVGSAVAIYDVTNIKRIEQEVLARASELEAVFSAQNDAVLMYDTGMNVKQVNQVFLTTYGFDPVGLNVKEIIQRLSWRQLDGRTLLLEEHPTQRALLGEKVTNTLFAITLPDGSDRIIETSSGPMFQENRVTGTVTVWHDITEFKQAEKKIFVSLKEKEVLLKEIHHRVKQPPDHLKPYQSSDGQLGQRTVVRGAGRCA